MGHDVREIEPVAELALIGACTRSLEGDRQAGVALDRHVPDLDVTEERHPVRTPVLERVREHVDVHEGAPGLARPELAQLAISVAEAKRGLARVDARTEELPFERRF